MFQDLFKGIRKIPGFLPITLLFLFFGPFHPFLSISPSVGLIIDQNVEILINFVNIAGVSKSLTFNKAPALYTIRKAAQ